MESNSVGARIRARRQELGLSLRDVADRSRLSKSFLSQVEIGRTAPSVHALARISDVLGMPQRSFVTGADAADAGGGPPAPSAGTPDDMVEPDRRVRVVRKDRRKRVVYPGGRAPLELLTPDTRGPFEVMLSHDVPGVWHDVERPDPRCEELVFVLDGGYELDIAGRLYAVGAGDSVYVTPGERYRVRATGDTQSRAVWLTIPPAF